MAPVSSQLSIYFIAIVIIGTNIEYIHLQQYSFLLYLRVHDGWHCMQINYMAFEIRIINWKMLTKPWCENKTYFME